MKYTNFETLKLCNYVKRLCVFASFICNSLIFINCANQMSPPGGPIDTEPPRIIETEPTPNTLNYKSNKFHFEFDKYVERRSFEEAVFVSPANVLKPKFEWSGEEVDVILPYELKDNKTYSITVGTDVVDIHNRNRMAESYTLAFSTGDKIDSFSISGKVYDGNTSGILISAYKIDSSNIDTLDPAKVIPDYTTQTGKDGDFTLKNLGTGTFRIFAIHDEYKNLVYDAMLDKIGSYWDEISLNDKKTFAAGIRIKTTLYDTTSLKLFEAEAKDNNHILLKFNRNIDPESVSHSSFIITDSSNGSGLKILGHYIQEGQTNQIRLFTDKLKESKYLFSLSGVHDSSGVYVDSNFSKYVFTGNNQKDTLKPGITLSIKDSMVNYCPSDPIMIKLNDIIDTSVFKKNISFSGKAEDVKYDIEVYHNSVINILPRNLAYNSWYKLYIPKEAIIGLNGLRMDKDSIEINFRTEERSSLTSISGNLEDSSYIIEALSDKNVKYKTKAKKDKTFRFDNIKEGKYTLFLFVDSDSNSVYSYGKVFPYKKPEKFFYFPDTLKVKAKWPLEDVKIFVPSSKFQVP
jgi:hypothetical protein